MGYITINTNIDVDVDINEFNEYELLEALEGKLENYKKNKKLKNYKSLSEAIYELLDEDVVKGLENDENDESIQEWLINKALQNLKNKYTLEQLESF